jgi:uncharacterized protein YdhG (YjbR/CyaY superfamily)
MQKYATVDEYIAGSPSDTSKLLQAIRQTILVNAPGATEKLSYGMPYYSLNGRLLYFGYFKDHVSLYPMKTGIMAFDKELKAYETSAGTIRFPLDKPLPVDLITKIVKFRVKQNLNQKK